MSDKTRAARGGTVDRDGQRAAAPHRRTVARTQEPDAATGAAPATARPAAHAATASHLLALQPTAGNRAVSGYLQRAPAHRTRAHAGNPEDYADLLTGVSR